ncbi:hypothetical protein CU097_004909 [Rhizopus azygosporus]|uniref:Uncharacterized protein n=1 Tax=Rhizopus azygosporus TaxID=86630 RepID=A0A367KCL2_RHIAZ|nr:hypothetical protein CU097_004909 [Rhizopus azygosporus]
MLHVNVDDTEEEHSHEGHISHKAVIKLAFMDVFANFCVTVGFSIIGSGMYQVIYSSVVIWCAVLTFLFMNRKLSILQWIAIFGTSAGLAMSSLDSMKGSDDAKEVKNGLLMFGTLMTLSGTFFYSCVYVYSDYILSKQIPPPLPARGTNTFTVLLMYIIVSVSNAVHSWNYYELIDRTGSVATGILQGLRAVLIYVISNSLYCQSDASQCFTVYKGLGSTLVIGSVLLFTISRR